MLPRPDNLPLCPGVYLFRDGAGRVIYVGKAALLRARLLSYFREKGLAPKTRAMMRRAESLETLPTATEKEALLLEASLIKKFRPRYNIVLRDDKRYPLFRLSRARDFPRLEIVRSAGKNDGARYFGPYADASAARRTWRLVHSAFGLRRCGDRAFAARARPCLYHHLRQCRAPCAGLVDAKEYALLLDRVEALLSGRSRELLEKLERVMAAASDALEFERAAALRDQIRAVRQTVEHQAAVLPDGGDLDALGLACAEHGLALGVVFVREGALLGGRTYFWPGLDSGAAGEALAAFPAQFYGGGMLPPPRILLPLLPAAFEGGGLAPLENALADLRGGPVRVAVARGRDERRLIDTACLHAREEAARRPVAPLGRNLARALHLPAPPGRIECVDVSHSSGAATRVGLVAFEDGVPAASAFRNYAVNGCGGDDHAALRAWLPRRLESGPPWPDLLLVDGGRGQLATVLRALGEAGREGLFPVAAIAKAERDGKADRRAGKIADRVFLPGRADPLPLKAGSPELLFLQRVRDEAHRFALGAHRRARRKEALAGELAGFPGIGPATAELLRKRFSSLSAMRRATSAELEALPGIGRRRAAALLEKLRKHR
jgi:excinuclease ABC subunit C